MTDKFQIQPKNLVTRMSVNEQAEVLRKQILEQIPKIIESSNRVIVGIDSEIGYLNCCIHGVCGKLELLVGLCTLGFIDFFTNEYSDEYWVRRFHRWHKKRQ